MDHPALIVALAATLLSAPAAARVEDGWVVPPIVASGTRLPVPAGATALWTADRLRVSDGSLVNDGDAPVTGRLTGTARTLDGRTIVKRFAVTVLGREAYRLTAYARVPTDVRAANQPAVARSVHLGLGPGKGAPRR